ncbi:MAG: hypothetical protein IJU70_01300 [Lentisphaeria bacterium]|nr:hypothetical protein [Lentisphaeria bacterium]
MKKYLKLESLRTADVPPELDLRILAAGRMRQTALRRRKRLRLAAGGAAAAAALVAAAGIGVLPGFDASSRSVREDSAALAAMSDWTNVEQAGYNLASEISSSSSFFELADTRSNFEV